MARGECLCRVPLEDAAVPVFARHAELIEWAKANRVQLLPDHQNRISISLPDAYRLRDEADAAALAHVEAQAARNAELDRKAAKAQQRRQEVYSKARAAARRKPMPWGQEPSDDEVNRAAWEAVHAAERDLPADIRGRLGPVGRKWGS